MNDPRIGSETTHRLAGIVALATVLAGRPIGVLENALHVEGEAELGLERIRALRVTVAADQGTFCQDSHRTGTETLVASRFFLFGRHLDGTGIR